MKEIGLQPLLGRILPKYFVRRAEQKHRAVTHTIRVPQVSRLRPGILLVKAH
jgi:hypothetical protein